MPVSILASSDAALGTPEWLRTNGVRILVVIAVALAVSRLGTLAIRRMRGRLEGSPNVPGAVNLRRTTTRMGILTSAFRVAIWTIVTFLVLGQLGIDLGPLIAGAGIIGVALGFGAQSLVRDFLSGFFILLENQFTVGDAVELITDVSGTRVSGRVESLTLRTTAIRAADGVLHVVPNGNLHIVSNRSRGQTDVEVDVRIARGEDPEEVRTLINALCREMRDDERIARRVFSGPEIVGIDQLDAETVILRVEAATSPARADEIRRDERIAARLFSGPDVLGVDRVSEETLLLRIGAETTPARSDEIREEIGRRIERRFAPVPLDVGVGSD